MVTLTVFTPLYNRINTLKRTYESLCRQTSKDFLWLIVDDGSIDNPYEVIKGWQKIDNGFEIQYIHKENGGMHTAHNTAYANTHTELNVCIDSDDYMTDNAVELIINCWKKNKDKGYAGIVALNVIHPSKKVLGKMLPTDAPSCTLTGYYEQGGEGDKKLIYVTSIINQTPSYPIFDNEKYVPLAYKYQLIDQKYTLAILNEPVCVVDYQEDGSSRSMYRQYINNPKGFAFWRIEQMKYGHGFKFKFKTCVHYVSSSLMIKNKNYVRESELKGMTILATPFGLALKVFVKHKAKNSSMHIDGIKK